MLKTAPMGKILLVDSDSNIADLLNFNLSSEGFTVNVINKASEVKINEVSEYRLAIIDAMDQDYNGLALTSAIKSNPESAHLPVILCTERESEDIIIEAFDSGAEDFISKPFSLRELLARIKAILRRHPLRTPVAKVQNKDINLPELGLVIEVENQRVIANDIVAPLTKTEYAILIFLIDHRNSFYTRADICKEVWKDDASSNIRIVDTNISRLRKKLGESGKFIINRYGMGYAFVDKIAQ